MALILTWFLTTGSNVARILSTEDLTGWPQDEVATLLRLGLLRKTAPAKTIICHECEESCALPVNVDPSRDGRPARAFIFCEQRDDAGYIPVNAEDLERWRIDGFTLASFLASSLDVNYPVEEIVPQQSFYLGQCIFNRKRWSALFVLNSDMLKSGIESVIFERFPRPVFLVAAGLSAPMDMRQSRAIPLSYVLLPSKTKVAVDCEEIERILSDKTGVRQDVIPISVPAGTKWEQVVISFVNEEMVQIKVAGLVENRSFKELGFSDLRASENENRSTMLWVILMQLSKFNGEITFQESEATFADPTKLKKWISQIKRKLKDVFPTIPDSPFYPYKNTKGYKTRFTLNTLPINE